MIQSAYTIHYYKIIDSYTHKEFNEQVFMNEICKERLLMQMCERTSYKAEMLDIIPNAIQ